MGEDNLKKLNLDKDSLPEGCIATILSLTTPRDACRMGLVASTFCSAAQSDAAWERFLPEDYWEILSRAVDGCDEVLVGKTKKEIYLYLCDHPVLIDGGTKSFSLEKGTGKKCFMLGARDLAIVLGDSPWFWRWISLPESRFPEVAEVLDRCWLVVQGHIKTSMLSPNTTYSAFLVFKTNRIPHGRGYLDAEGSFGITGEKNETRPVCLDPNFANNDRYQIVPVSRRMGLSNRRSSNPMRMEEPFLSFDGNIEFPEQRANLWNEVCLGEFHVKEGQDCELEVSLMETKAEIWSTGLIIEGIEIRPKEKYC